MSIAHDKPIDRAPAERNVHILSLNMLNDKNFTDPGGRDGMIFGCLIEHLRFNPNKF